jgi:hypothetical protein
VFFATGANPVSGTATSTGTSTRIYTGMDLRGQNWHYIRIYNSSSSGSGAAGQVARIKAGGLGNGYVDIDYVWNTGSKVIDPASGALAMRWMLQSGRPTRMLHPPAVRPARLHRRGYLRNGGQQSTGQL